MTRDEVMALSDEELQITAARHAGFSEVGIAYVSIPWLMDICEDMLAGRIGGELVAIPDYPHDIAAAWELVKQLERDGFKTSVHTGMIDPMTGDVLDDSSAAIWNHDDIYWVGTAGPGESPLAITRAFVLAMTEGK